MLVNQNKLSQSHFLNSLSVLISGYVFIEGILWISYIFHTVTVIHLIFSFYWAILYFATGFLKNRVPDYSYCFYFAHALFWIKKTWLSEQGNLNIELYLKQRLHWCPCMTIETRDCQITAACIMSSGKTERGNESCCSSDLQEDEVTSLQIWFPGFRSPCLKFLRPRGNSEHLPFRFPCCSMHHPQSICVSVTMVTLSTVYFLMLTQNSAPSTQGKCNLKYLKHTGVALRNLTSSASMTTPVDGPTP